MISPETPAGSNLFFPRAVDLPRTSDGHRADLDYVRASGIAQARLQVAVLAGNRHRVLEQIDRLVAIDSQLARLADGRSVPPCGDLDTERLALASEKLALTAGVELPRLDPAFGAGLGAAIAPGDQIEIVDADAVRGGLWRALALCLAFVVLCLVVAGAALALL